MRAFDTSRYATGNQPISSTTVAALRVAFDLAIIGAWHGTEGYDAAEQSLSDCHTSGMEIATYAALSPGKDASAAVDEAKARCGRAWESCRFCAIDVETDGVTHDQIATATERIVTLSMLPIVYTSKYKWQSLLANTPDFRTLYLWDAWYNGAATLDDFISGTYGGWTWDTLAGKQYSNSTVFRDISIDYNTFADEKVWKMHAPEPPLVTLLRAWNRDMTDLSVNASLLTNRMNPTMLALHTVYTEERNRAWQALLEGGK